MQAQKLHRFFDTHRAMWLTATMVLGMFALIACGDSDSPQVSGQSEENKQVVARFIEEFKNRANHDIVDELLTTDFVHHLKDPRLPPGRPAIKLLGQSIVGETSAS